jgi:hypothetical protein
MENELALTDGEEVSDPELESAFAEGVFLEQDKNEHIEALKIIEEKIMQNTRRKEKALGLKEGVLSHE